MKKIIILKNNGGRLANQLWHHASVYTYCLEKELAFESRAFFRYQHYFDSIKGGLFANFLNKFYVLIPKSYKILAFIQIIYVVVVKKIFRNHIVDDNDKVFFLPPTKNNTPGQQDLLNQIDWDKKSSWYFCGWLFRNPDGLDKYRQQIIDFFKPNDRWFIPVRDFIANLRKTYQFVVGVHIRQGDYKTWDGGQYYFTGKEVRKILDDFLMDQSIFTKDNTVFLLCSDGVIEEQLFAGLHITKGLGGEVIDLYTLAKTDLIIGSTSTYGGWAAYYGSIPFVKFSRDKIDWSVLNNKKI